MRPEDFSRTLADARTGSGVALGILFRDLHPRMVRYLRAFAPEEAEDLASDCWLDVACALDTFDGDRRALRAMALTVARNRLMDDHPHLRPSVLASGDTLLFPFDEGTDWAVGNGADVPLVDVADHDGAEIATDEALERVAALPPEQADVILLTILGELTVDEVAGTVGTRPGTVRQIQHRALVRLFHGAAEETIRG